MLLQSPPPYYGTPPYERTMRRPDKGLKPAFKGMILWHIAFFCYYLCQSCNGESPAEERSIQFVDLTYEFNSETIYYGFGKPYAMTITHNGTDKNGNWRQSEEIAAATHGGTHLDAPCHFALGRWCVSDIPLKHLVAPAVVVDISAQVGDDPTVHLSSEHLTAWESAHGPIPDKSVLLLRTGWSKFWPDKERYTGTAGNNPADMNYPSVYPEAAQWLVDNRNILGFGIDTVSVDIPRSPLQKAHKILEDQNIYGIENVNDNLKLLPPTGATVYVMPMKLKDASGAPCRVIATIQPADNNNAICSTFSCNVIVTLCFCIATYVLWANNVPSTP